MQTVTVFELIYILGDKIMYHELEIVNFINRLTQNESFKMSQIEIFPDINRGFFPNY